MAYVDYKFYQTEYMGNVIPNNEFDKYSSYASDRIDNITFDRLVDGLPESERNQKKIKKSVCAVADTLYQIDQIRKANMETVGVVKDADGTVRGKMISSVSSGTESMSFVTVVSGAINDIYTQASMDKKVEYTLIRQVATEYLAGVTDDKGVCLLYAGMR